MAASTQISIEEYLRSSYRPDREYLDGELREKSLGTREHARVQLLLAAWFARHEIEWNVMTYTEWRTRVSSTRVRIPDVIVDRVGPQPDVLVEAPLLVVEILSPDDSYSETQRRASDYIQMGVKTIWIIDPETRSGRMCIGDAWIAGSRLEVPGSAVYLDLSDLFRYLDRPVAR